MSLCAGPDSILSPGVLSARDKCQVTAARFICHCYGNQRAVGDSNATLLFNNQAALLSLLTEGHDLRKPVHVQLVSAITYVQIIMQPVFCYYIDF